ncbi:MAG: GGDEF domain-containing protein, partial [Actinomycetota bacterium]|nr:GGDEF domain-containing protein [Actinomycetota bacterium]
ERRGEQLELVSQITRKLATSLEPSRALCEMAVDLTNASGAAVYRRVPEGAALLAWEGGSPRELRDLGLSVANIAIDDFRSNSSEEQFRVYGPETPELQKYAPAWIGFDVGSIVCAPARAENDVIGLLVLAWPTGHDPADSGMPMDMLAAEASIAIRKQELTEQLEHLATTDPLTGIDNRRGWNRMISAAVGRSRRHSQPLCLAILDLDGFKTYNDTHGHQAGDALLRQTASTWQGLIRVDDHIARYGGDEFVVTLPHTSLESAMDVIDRLRQAVPPETRCSAGVALWDGEEPVGNLLERADRALYLAKADGSGQVRSALLE